MHSPSDRVHEARFFSMRSVEQPTAAFIGSKLVTKGSRPIVVTGLCTDLSGKISKDSTDIPPSPQDCWNRLSGNWENAPSC